MFSQMFAKRISFGLISFKQPIRGYAKKTKGKSKLKAEPEIPPSDALDLTKYTNSMIKSVDWFKQELGGMALGRASPGLLSSVVVEHVGGKVPLKQLAQITVKDPSNLFVSIIDEEFTPAVEKAIINANLGLNPIKVQPTTLRVPIPKLSRETKATFIKTLSSNVQKCKASIGLIRADARNDLKKLKLPKDESDGIENAINELTRKYTKEVISMMSSRQQELKVA